MPDGGFGMPTRAPKGISRLSPRVEFRAPPFGAGDGERSGDRLGKLLSVPAVPAPPRERLYFFKRLEPPDRVIHLLPDRLQQPACLLYRRLLVHNGSSSWQ
jgi:hypothetical protein